MKIIPTPKVVQPSFYNTDILTFAPIIMQNDEFSEAVESFVSYTEKLYGISIAIGENALFRIVKDRTLDAEAYRVTVGGEGINIYGNDSVGVNHAFATILQMMQIKDGSILLPAVTIEDKPDCNYRGMMVDLARNWHPFPSLLSFVDMCYFYKVLVLQLHFTDDQSYTLPSRVFPKLSTEGRYYTHEQIAELVEYAHARGVEISPETDVPGHCTSFGEAYGELFGTKGVICQHEDSMEAMRDLFRELCDMFPYSKYIHIGGDEAYAMDEWTKCPNCHAYAKSVGIDSNMEDKKMLAELMYAHFVSEMANVCFTKGKQPIVWEGFGKVVNDKISKDILVMSWENLYQLTPDLLEAGFKVINCSWNPMYVVTPLAMWEPEELYDWSIYQWKAMHPDSPYYETVYKAQKESAILGGQLLAWGDHIPTQYETVAEGVYEERDCLIQRLPILAENTWNVQKVSTYVQFSETVDEQNKKLETLIN